MSLSIGIVGLPNVGKSTLFKILTKKQVDAANYPFCTIEPNVGIVEVPDSRLDLINKISNSRELIPASIKFVDIAGLVAGAHKGEGLGNKFLSNIRECDAICEVIRNFENDDIVHVNNKVDPNSDKSIIETELILADLETVNKRLEKLSKEVKTGNKEIIIQNEILKDLSKFLGESKAARNFEVHDDYKKFIKNLNLLTSKPIIYVLNVDDDSSKLDCMGWDGKVIELNIKLEEEIVSLEKSEQLEYIKELGLERSGLDKLIQTSYSLLGLITFFTTGKEETRAWTVKKNSSAPVAAGKIHSDIEKGFIRAEIINQSDFIAVGGEQNARTKGLMRVEGKEYIIQDGDICHFLHNS